MEGENMVLNEHDRGRTVTLNAGSILTVRLQENPTTGYRWSASMSKGIELIGDRYETGGAIGAASVRVFEFRAMKKGSYQINMKNWREFDGASSEIDRFDAKIIVK
jgi:inhibitor of cysteine peptidase